jgi:two-component system alkaline phosphatase synthesis response regulator PhoP
VEGEKVTLTFKEYELLHYLLLNTNIVLSRERIMEEVWGYDYEGESRTVNMHIKTLRQKLGTAREHIKTIRNVGYKLGE